MKNLNKILLYVGFASTLLSFGDYINFNNRLLYVKNFFKSDSRNVNKVEGFKNNFENEVLSLKLKPSDETYDINDLSLKVKKVSDEEYFVYLNYTTSNFDVDIPVYKKVNGPQLGSLKYIYSNLSQQDKISFLEFYVRDSTNIFEKALKDIWNNKEDIYFDVKRKLFDYFEGLKD